MPLIVWNALLWIFALSLVAVGAMHFVRPEPFVAIVPAYLPWPLMLVYVSGVFEILGGIGLLVPMTRVWAAWGLIALFMAVFPANINMLIHEIPFGDLKATPWMLWARLPFQLVFIGLAWMFTRPAPLP